MKRTLVRYRVRPEEVEENERLIRNVFAELQAKSVVDVRYLALKVGADAFVHLVEFETSDGSSPITGLHAFQVFQAGIRSRCLELPEAGAASIVGNYRMLSEWRGN